MESRRTRRSRAIVLRLVAILAWACLPRSLRDKSQPRRQTPRTVSISPTVTTISFPATTATVDVNIDNATGVKGYLIQIAYDNEAVVQESAVSDGLGTLVPVA